MAAPAQHIVVIEDEESIRELVVYNLERAGFKAHAAATGEEGLRLTRNLVPSLVVLDLMLPGIDGLEVCKLLKDEKPELRNIPIIMMSAKGEESDVVTGLEMGAEDYVTKPFSPKILVARIKAILRRNSHKYQEGKIVLENHGIEIDPGRFEVRLDGQPVELTASQFKILHFLSQHVGWVFTRYQIVDEVKGENYAVTERAIDVQVAALRKRLGKHGEAIETVRGVGYRLKE